MFLTLLAAVATTGFAEPPPAVAEGNPPATFSGTCRLKCDSQWHQLDLALRARGKVRLSADFMQAFHPDPEARVGDSRVVEGKALEPLIRFLSEVTWESAPEHAEAYRKWQGNGPGQQIRRTQGSLKVSLTQTGETTRVEFKGTLTVLDEGQYAGRFGPNSWRDNWTHEISGSLTYEKDAAPSFELLDTFRVEGRHFTDPAVVGETNTRTGSLRLVAIAPKPLAPEMATRVLTLIKQLGDGAFKKREDASRALAGMGPEIAPLLLRHGLTSRDAEVRMRARRILEQFGEDVPE